MNIRLGVSVKQKFAGVSASIGMFLIPLAVSALEGGTEPRKLSWGLKNPIGAETIQELILQITNAAVLIMSPVIVLMLIYSGFLFVYNANNPEKLKKAQNTLLWTVIGAAIVLGAKGIALAIQATIVQL